MGGTLGKILGASEKPVDMEFPIKKLVICSVCWDTPMKSPIYQCYNGHLICFNCEQRVQSCPTCRATLPKLNKIRNRAMESVQSMMLRCENMKYGCDAAFLCYCDLVNHQENCRQCAPLVQEESRENGTVQPSQERVDHESVDDEDLNEDLNEDHTQLLNETRDVDYRLIVEDSEDDDELFQFLADDLLNSNRNVVEEFNAFEAFFGVYDDDWVDDDDVDHESGPTDVRSDDESSGRHDIVSNNIAEDDGNASDWGVDAGPVRGLHGEDDGEIERLSAERGLSISNDDDNSDED